LFFDILSSKGSKFKNGLKSSFGFQTSKYILWLTFACSTRIPQDGALLNRSEGAEELPDIGFIQFL